MKKIVTIASVINDEDFGVLELICFYTGDTKDYSVGYFIKTKKSNETYFGWKLLSPWTDYNEAKNSFIELCEKHKIKLSETMLKKLNEYRG